MSKPDEVKALEDSLFGPAFKTETSESPDYSSAVTPKSMMVEQKGAKRGPRTDQMEVRFQKIESDLHQLFTFRDAIVNRLKEDEEAMDARISDLEQARIPNRIGGM